MKILPIQDVYSRKFERQRRIAQLQYHAAGHCVHLGKISPGCYGCFVADRYARNIVAGDGCNSICDYCASGSCTSLHGPDGRPTKEEEAANLARFEADRVHLINDAKEPDYSPSKISFSGGGEPLMYLDNIARYMKLFHELHKDLEPKPWYYLYTNGTRATEENLRRLRDLGFDEIRFHLGATNFSERVYENMRTAARYIGTISVETPAWPPHREKLFEMLPILQDIGVKHLNITELELNPNNFKRVSEIFPEGEICQAGELQLYDGGLVYDLMEEVVAKGYTYSVLDCNCFVKSIQRTPGKWLHHETIQGLCAEPESRTRASRSSSKDPAMLSAIRDEYFDFFSRNGVVYPAAGNISKPALGELSPGCRTCAAGTWCCLFVTEDCTRECFFCPSVRKHDQATRPYIAENFSFGSIHGFLEYLERFDFDGVSFSGGEPLLVLDTVLEYIEGIRRWFGNRHHIWAYTNGSLVTDEALAALRDAGLNELRFDIAADSYDLTAVARAVEFIETVTVEIPAIPEDTEILKPLLLEMERVGVKHLNLHQLMRTAVNAEQLSARGYTAVNEDSYPDNSPILESEFAALDVLRYAIETGSKLPINYCSRCYKSRFQGKGHRERAARFHGEDRIGRTPTGYLRRLAVDASSEEAARVTEQATDGEWEIVTLEGEAPKLVFPLTYFDALSTTSFQSADVLYLEPMVTAAANGVSDTGMVPVAFAGNTVYPYKVAKIRKTLGNSIAARLFRELFIERREIEAVTDELLELHGVGREDGSAIVQDIATFYGEFQEIEYVPPDLDAFGQLFVAGAESHPSGRPLMPRSVMFPTRARGIGSEAFADGMLLLCHQGAGGTIHLNSSASSIWALCDGSRSIAEIQGFLESAYPEAGDGMRAELDSVLEMLHESRAIEYHYGLRDRT